MKNFLAIIFFSVVAGVSSAEDQVNLLGSGGYSAILATTNNFYIEVIDQVEDGCLPYPGKLKDKFELVLRQNGLSIQTERIFTSPVIVIKTLGYEARSGSCVVNIESVIEKWSLVYVPYSEDVASGKTTFVNIGFGGNSNLLSGGKQDMQSRLEKVAQEHAEAFVLRRSRDIDHIKKYFPSIIRNYNSDLQD